jgi:2'-5' RNA ligase
MADENDKGNNEHDDSVMIALLPITTDWCKIDLPHLTLVYAGKKKDLDNTSYGDLAKDAASIAQMSRPIVLEVLGREMFGNWSTDPNDAVDVYRLRKTPEIEAMRSVVERWNKSEFPFNPHVTIGPPGVTNGYDPGVIAFNRIGVFWGDQSLVFNFKV